MATVLVSVSVWGTLDWIGGLAEGQAEGTTRRGLRRGDNKLELEFALIFSHF